VSARPGPDAEAALRERVKELTCLYGIAQLASEPGFSLGRVLQGIADLLPPAWQYPEITSGRIEVDSRDYPTTGFEGGAASQRAKIAVAGRPRGFVEVVYSTEQPELDEGPFLKEERALIDAIAQQVALIIERREAEKERARLQEQLLHADRLATIGQLAAGVAHEINEPLGNILGFAQLVKKVPDVPEEAAQDLEKIVNASLRAREIIRKLMVFARQAPPSKSPVNLNDLIEDGITFFEARCAKAGVELVRKPAPDLPEVTADQSQLSQVLINLVVNALQAMPGGGRLTVETHARPGEVVLLVADTGAGMSEEVRRKIFLPFFTTKDVNEGTGLGLAVVHGIVTAHGGSISVESAPGRGTRFEVRLPTAGPERNRKEG